ncbi:hypothetical protein ACFOWE_09600 [Planomonospora corallina]|uniref:DUF998 domain-containing protein n=1 Tax=Planomonospora corallina TaxID=1806052 RepID=A0ABV8I2Y4_9ACTN
MTRRSRWLWAAAVLCSVAPAAYLWIGEVLVWMGPPREDVGGEAYGDSVVYGMVGLYSGGGLLKASILLEHVHGSPALALGAVPYVLLGLGACLLAARLGRPRAGRVTAGVLAAALALVYSLRPALCSVRAATESGSYWSLSSSATGDLLQVAAAALMVLALRSGRRAVRRG